ncbi:MAG: efflux RND transporter periplasmic adaptor subunit [Candidatus Korobacteraceae bacterium]
MDIPRQSATRNRRWRRVMYAASAGTLILLVTLGVSRLKPAPPTVDRSSLWTDTVKRGPLLRQVRGLGRLTPTNIRWISAPVEGRVEQVLLLPGTQVSADTILLELANPQLVQETLDAVYKLRAAEAQAKNLVVQLRSQVLAQKAQAAQVQAEFNEAQAHAETDRELFAHGIVSQLALKVSQSKAAGLKTRNEVEWQRLASAEEVIESQLAEEQANIAQARALYELKTRQLSALQVRASVNGVVQELPIQPGQLVMPGATLAKIVQPEELKAELKVPETQAKDLQLGQPASVDTRNGVIPGHITRIDPAAQNGTVTVDVALDGPLPPGARPDLSVDGAIDLERLADVLYVNRPTSGQEESSTSLFRLEPEGSTAVRIAVKLGRASVSAIEVREGLREGDQIVLSDMSRWDNYEIIQLD